MVDGIKFKENAWTQGSGSTGGNIKEVAISRSVSSRTMSAADCLRSWRSANENKCNHIGQVRTGGRFRGETAVRHRGRDRSRGRKDVRHCGRDRSSRKHRNGPQSRAKTQTHLIGGENASGLHKYRGSRRNQSHGASDDNIWAPAWGEQWAAADERMIWRTPWPEAAQPAHAWTGDHTPATGLNGLAVLQKLQGHVYEL